MDKKSDLGDKESSDFLSPFFARYRRGGDKKSNKVLSSGEETRGLNSPAKLIYKIFSYFLDVADSVVALIYRITDLGLH